MATAYRRGPVSSLDAFPGETSPSATCSDSAAAAAWTCKAEKDVGQRQFAADALPDRPVMYTLTDVIRLRRIRRSFCQVMGRQDPADKPVRCSRWGRPTTSTALSG